jgi:hypothetical protein
VRVQVLPQVQEPAPVRVQVLVRGLQGAAVRGLQGAAVRGLRVLVQVQTPARVQVLVRGLVAVLGSGGAQPALLTAAGVVWPQVIRRCHVPLGLGRPAGVSSLPVRPAWLSAPRLVASGLSRLSWTLGACRPPGHVLSHQGFPSPQLDFQLPLQARLAQPVLPRLVRSRRRRAPV